MTYYLRASKGSLYSWQHDEFGATLRAKVNEIFNGTKIYINPSRRDQFYDRSLIPISAMEKMAVSTAIYKDSSLQSANLKLLTPELVEEFIKKREITPVQCTNIPSEYLALILWSRRGYKNLEMYSQAMYNSLFRYRKELGLTELDLVQPIVILNAGLEKDDAMPRGVKPVILPGFSKAFSHELLETNGNWAFANANYRGLPTRDNIWPENQYSGRSISNRNLRVNRGFGGLFDVILDYRELAINIDTVLNQDVYDDRYLTFCRK